MTNNKRTLDTAELEAQVGTVLPVRHLLSGWGGWDPCDPCKCWDWGHWDGWKGWGGWLGWLGGRFDD